MKKTLLTLAALAVTAGAWADFTPGSPFPEEFIDVTPSYYKFHKGATDLDKMVRSDLTSPGAPSLGSGEFISNNLGEGKYFTSDNLSKGNLMFGGPFGQNNQTLVKNGLTLYNMGDEIGTVLILNGPDSNLGAALKEKLGLDSEPEISKLESFGGNIQLFWILDHLTMNEEIPTGSKIRVRLELNGYNSDMNSTKEVFNYLDKTDQLGNSTKQGSNVTFKEFNDGSDTWNPNRWMIYDVEIPYNRIACYFRILLNQTLSGLNEGALLIRSIEVYGVPSGYTSEWEEGTVYKTWKDYSDVDGDGDGDDEGDGGDEKDPDPTPGVEGEDITPANYKFSEGGILPIHPTGKVNDINIAPGAWATFNDAAYWNDGLLFVGSGGGLNQAQHDSFINSWNYIDFGGQVGRVAVYINKGADTVNELKALNPEEDWDSLNVNENVFGGGALNFYLDPENTPKTGYIHAKFVLNINDKDYGPSPTAIQWIGVRDDANNNMSILNGKTYAEDGPANTDGAAIKKDAFVTDDKWDPTKWMTYEFDFTVGGEGSGAIINQLPVRMKLFFQGSQATNTSAIFFKEISFTHVTDGSTPELGTRKQTVNQLEIEKPKIDFVPGPVYDIVNGVAISHPQNDDLLELSAGEEAEITVAMTTLSGGNVDPETELTVTIDNNESNAVEASQVVDGVLTVSIAEEAGKNENVQIKVATGEYESNVISLTHYAAPQSVELSHSSIEILDNEITMKADDSAAEFDAVVVSANGSEAYQKFNVTIEDSAEAEIQTLSEDVDVAEITLTENNTIQITPKNAGQVTFSVNPYRAGEAKANQEPSDHGKTIYTLSIGTSGIELLNHNTGEVEYYDLKGVKVANPQNGIFIRKQGNSTSKVIVK